MEAPKTPEPRADPPAEESPDERLHVPTSPGFSVSEVSEGEQVGGRASGAGSSAPGTPKVPKVPELEGRTPGGGRVGIHDRS